MKLQFIEIMAYKSFKSVEFYLPQNLISSRSSGVGQILKIWLKIHAWV